MMHVFQKAIFQIYKRKELHLAPICKSSRRGLAERRPLPQQPSPQTRNSTVRDGTRERKKVSGGAIDNGLHTVCKRDPRSSSAPFPIAHQLLPKNTLRTPASSF